jgi:hypothetical protein
MFRSNSTKRLLIPLVTVVCLCVLHGSLGTSTGPSPAAAPAANRMPAEEDYPPAFTDNIDSIPDFTQSDERAQFPNRGFYICGLAAASNSLMWLDAHGYPGLVENTGDPFNKQVKLIRTLGLPAYTGMHPSKGTTSGQLMRGVFNYVKDHGYKVKRLDYHGWYQRQKSDPNKPCPELAWLKRGMLHKGAVWLAVGFYAYDKDTHNYRYHSGHWVTLVGYTADALIVHDPSPAAGDSFSNTYLTPTLLKAGTVFNHRSRGRPATSCFELVGLKTPKAGSTAILEEAIVLQLEPPN